MRTTELYVEQVFIGFLVLAGSCLLWLPELWNALREIDTARVLAAGSIALGLAFWLGIPFDRCADTLSERLERHSRLRFALYISKGRVLPHRSKRDKLAADPFPEGKLRLAGLRDKPAVVDWLDYHRSRIRLTRALAVYGPGFLLALTVGLLRWLVPGENLLQPAMWLAAIAAAYAIWGSLATRGSELPRTDGSRLLAYARAWGYIRRRVDPVKAGKRASWTWCSEWRLLAVPIALLVAAFLLALAYRDAVSIVAVFAGAFLVILSAWSWWRISATYRSYLYDLDRYPIRSS